MSAKYIPNGSTKIVIDHKTYQNDGGKKASLPVDKISAEELQRLVNLKLVVKLEFDENGSSKDKDAEEKAAEKAAKKREALNAKAKELGIDPDAFDTDEKLVEKIKEVQAKK